MVMMRYGKLISVDEVKKVELLDVQRNNSRRHPDLRGFATAHPPRKVIDMAKSPVILTDPRVKQPNVIAKIPDRGGCH
jgi:hypothetical protein